MNKQLVSDRAYFGVIGGLLNQPQLIDCIDLPLERDDFNTDEFYEVIFVAIHNLYLAGATTIDELTVDSYLSAYKHQYQVFQDNNGLDFLVKARELSSCDNYEYWYHVLKKFSLLRYYEDKGLNIRPVYDYTITDPTLQEQEQKNLENITEQDIIDSIEDTFVIQPKIRYCSSAFIDEGTAGDGLEELIDQFLETPDYGYPLASIGLTTLSRGCRTGALFLRSIVSGGGKTRMGMMDACNLAIPWHYDLKKKEFVYTGLNVPTLFIEVEQERKDLQTIAVSCVSGVPTGVIKNARYKGDELQRVRQATKYIKDSPSLHIAYLDEYSILDIENLIKKYVLTHKIEVCVFDYLQSSIKMLSDTRKQASVGLQEYQILRIFATKLKALAQRLGITIISATQLNGDASSMKYKDQNSLEGSKSVANKIDLGVVCSKPTNLERAKLEKITSHQVGCPEINLLQWCYKVRDGEYSRIIICSHIDLGTLRIQDCFVTDYDFNLIDMKFDEVQMETVEEVISENSVIDDVAEEETANEEPVSNYGFNW